MDTEQVTNEQSAKTKGKETSSLWTWMSVIGAIFTVGAWCVMMGSEKVSFWCAVIGLVLSCLGVKCGHRGWRNLSITAIIAAAVLLLVYGIFWGAIFFTMKSL